MNFKTALFYTKEFYDLDLNPDTFEEIGLVAWELIGNKKTRLYKYSTKIDCETNTVELPCNVDIIEAVTYNFEEWKYVTNYSPTGDYNSQFIENYIESRKLFENPLYISGKYAKFERIGDTLYFDKNYGTVNILYKGIILDEEGLPDLSEKEALAIATYCAHVLKYKEGLRTNNPNIILMAQLLEQRWRVQCDAARITYLNQNDMNEILDVKSSWNRKIFGKSYKPIK